MLGLTSSSNVSSRLFETGRPTYSSGVLFESKVSFTVSRMGLRRDIVIVGAGGHGRETALSALLQLSGHGTPQLIGFLDDDPHANTEQLLKAIDLRLLGNREWLRDNNALYTLGIGSPVVRKALDQELSKWGREAWSVVHPGASVGKANRLADGSIVAQGVVITTNVDIGRHTHLNVNSSVSHDSVIGPYVTISPGAVICGSCAIEEGAYIGANACVLQGITVGKGATVGAGACVVADVAPGQTVVGVPARPFAGDR
jgi:sugar O-acyltransferase (sialic acid O-acetyltransferase NeuD family)